MMIRNITFVAIFLLLSCSSIFPRLFSNTSEIAFINTTEDPKITSITHSDINIKELIVMGANYFLEGQEYLTSLSKKIEIADLSSFDLYSAQNDLSNAYFNMLYAWYYYGLLVNKANETPYNPLIIEKLKVFPYDSFRINNSLVKEIFDNVKLYLQKGDVRGIYTFIKVDLERIFSMIQKIQYSLDFGRIPDNETIWNLNQQCAKTLLSGQYIARIFSAIN